MPLKRTPRGFFFPPASSAAAAPAERHRALLPRGRPRGGTWHGGHGAGDMVLGTRCWGTRCWGHGAGGHGVPWAQPACSRPHQGPAQPGCCARRLGACSRSPARSRLGAAGDAPPGPILALVVAPFLWKEGERSVPRVLALAVGAGGRSSPELASKVTLWQQQWDAGRCWRGTVLPCAVQGRTGVWQGVCVPVCRGTVWSWGFLLGTGGPSGAERGFYP